MLIDLRSDTVTRPTPEMRAAMLAAPVGDDVYGEDPTVSALEQRTAELLGHEAGLYCATGSLANVLGVRLLVEPGQEVICDVEAHIARAEMGAHAALHGLTMRTFGSHRGLLEVDEVARVISPDAGPYLVSTAAVALENTHNCGGGTIQPYEQLRQVSDLVHQHRIGLHLDGARLFNAAVATGVSLRDYGVLFDTVSVCFSKGLGAPVGSVLVSSAAQIARARVWRKRLGGGWRQAGMLAAAALHALDHHVDRLAEDHRAARLFAEAVAGSAPRAVDVSSVATNIVVLDSGEVPAVAVVQAALEQGVQVSAVGRHVVRAVTHLDVGADDCARAGSIVGEILGGATAPQRVDLAVTDPGTAAPPPPAQFLDLAGTSEWAELQSLLAELGPAAPVWRTRSTGGEIYPPEDAWHSDWDQEFRLLDYKHIEWLELYPRPDVVGMTLDDVRQVCEAIGFEIEIEVASDRVRVLGYRRLS